MLWKRSMARQDGWKKKGKGWKSISSILFFKNSQLKTQWLCLSVGKRHNQGSPQALHPEWAALRLWPCQVGNITLGSSWGGLTALSSPSLKIHLKAVVRTNCGVKKGRGKKQGRLCQHWKAVAGRPTLLAGVWLEGPHSCLECLWHAAAFLL